MSVTHPRLDCVLVRCSNALSHGHPVAAHVQAVLERELLEHHREQRAALNGRLRERRKAREEALRKAGAGAEEVAAAMKALDFEDEK